MGKERCIFAGLDDKTGRKTHKIMGLTVKIESYGLLLLWIIFAIMLLSDDKRMEEKKMSRSSENQINEKTGLIWNGFDYDRQCWIQEGIIQRCGHPFEMPCGCFGRKYAGADYYKVVTTVA